MDPFYNLQWYLNNDGLANTLGYDLKKKFADIGAEAAWVLANGGTGIKIALIDPDFSVHPDYTNNIRISTVSSGGALLLKSKNPPNSDRDKSKLVSPTTPSTEPSHGTAILGIVGAEKNGTGLQGIAYNGELIPIMMPINSKRDLLPYALKYASDPRTLFTGANVNDAADVINMSFGDESNTGISDDLTEALAWATVYGRKGKGNIIIWSVSNSYKKLINDDAIAQSNRILKVGRSSLNDQNNGSAYGPELELLAPGMDFLVLNESSQPFRRSRYGRPISPGTISSSDDGFTTGTFGTSWAAPVVSGVVALMLQANPNLTWVEIKYILKKTAFPIEIDNQITGYKWKDKTGNDIVDSNRNLIPLSGNTILSNPITDPNDNTIRDVDITVQSASGFQVGQVIMIGARTKTTAAITSSTQIQVQDPSLFKQNHYITLGTDFSTTIFQTAIDPEGDSELNVVIPPNQVNVKSKSGFIVGQKVILEGSNWDDSTGFPAVTQSGITIQAISSDSTRLTLSANRTVEYNEQACLKVVGKQSGLKIVSISGNIITLDSAITDTAAHPAGTLVEIEGTEIVFVRKVDLTNNILTVNKLQNSIPIPTMPATIPVIGGRIPYRCDQYGFGRVDAYQAIKEANEMLLALQTNTPYYDLYIRDDVGDDGKTLFTGTINSPDIAVSYTNSFPGSTGDRIDHEDPLANSDRYVHVQIKNIGTKACLDAEVRLFLKVVPSGPTTFNFPDDWNTYENLKEVEDSTSPGLYLFNEDVKKIGEGSINPGLTGQYTFKWPKKYVPSSDPNFDTYLMAMISPFDGILTGTTVNNNNNISYKKVQIIYNILFKDSIGGVQLPKTISLSAYSAAQNFPFAIQVKDSATFNFNIIEITFKRKNRKETDETATFKNSGGVWKFDGATPNWVSFNTTPSTASGTIANFVGSYKVTPEQKYIEISVKAIDPGASPPINFAATHRLKVAVTDVSEIEDTSKGGSKMHFYTNVDTNLQMQSALQAFGPFTDVAKPTKDLFRITNLHTSTATTDPKAYAVCDGLVCAQEISSTLVNLIVKPFQQPAVNFAPIKYIIYKGIKRASLFSGNDMAALTSNSLTKTIWDSHTSLKTSIDHKIADMTAAGAPPAAIPTPLPAVPTKSALGLDLTAALDATKYGNDKAIENLFLKADPNFQYPIIRGGWDIGDFDKTSFGVEIVFESVGYKPTLDKVRVLENVIELDKITGTETDIVKFEAKLAREEVLNYMDAAAFFGSMYSNRAFIITSPTSNTTTNSFTQKNTNEIYTDLIKLKFLKCNRTYIDIRNEHSYSFNFYSNYTNTIRIGFDGASPVNTVNYYDNDYGWPLLIIENSKFSSSDTSFAKKIEIALPVANVTSGGIIENAFPLAYISQGYSNISRGTILKGRERFVELTAQVENGTLISNYTKESIKLQVPNGSTSATEVVTSYIRIKYLKRFDPTFTSTPASSSGLVLRAQNYLDNLFVPVNMQIPYNSTNNLNSVVFDEEAYIDATNSDVNFDCIAKIGLAEDANNNVTLFAFATDVRIRNKDLASSRFAISGESNDTDSDYLAQLVNQNKGVTAAKNELTILGNAVPYVSLLDATPGYGSFDKVDPDDFFSLVITKAQFDDIVLIAADPGTFDQKFKVYLAIANKINGTDDNGLAYTQFDLVLRGYKLFSSDYQIVEVAVTPTITIYSNGNI